MSAARRTEPSGELLDVRPTRSPFVVDAGKPAIYRVPPSSLFGQVSSFLPALREANKNVSATESGIELLDSELHGLSSSDESESESDSDSGSDLDRVGAVQDDSDSDSEEDRRQYVQLDIVPMGLLTAEDERNHPLFLADADETHSSWTPESGSIAPDLPSTASSSFFEQQTQPRSVPLAVAKDLLALQSALANDKR